MIRSYEIHVPSFEGTATAGWDPPDDDCEPTLRELADHYLLSESGFPPAGSEDLALPVVDGEGRLHRSALVHARRELRERDDLTVATVSQGLVVVSALLGKAFAPAERSTDDSTPDGATVPGELSEAEATLRGLTVPGGSGAPDDSESGESPPTDERPPSDGPPRTGDRPSSDGEPRPDEDPPRRRG